MFGTSLKCYHYAWIKNKDESVKSACGETDETHIYQLLLPNPMALCLHVLTNFINETFMNYWPWLLSCMKKVRNTWWNEGLWVIVSVQWEKKYVMFQRIIIILCNIMFGIAYWFFLIRRCIYDRLNHIKTLYTFVYKRVYIYNIVQTNDIEASISTTNGIKSQGIDFWKTLRRMENTEKIAKRILVKSGVIHLSLELMRRACTLLSKISVVRSIYTY